MFSNSQAAYDFFGRFCVVACLVLLVFFYVSKKRNTKTKEPKRGFDEVNGSRSRVVSDQYGLEHHRYVWLSSPTPENIMKALEDHPDVLFRINNNRRLLNELPLTLDDLRVVEYHFPLELKQTGGSVQQKLPLSVQDFINIGLAREVS